MAQRNEPRIINKQGKKIRRSLQTFLIGLLKIRCWKVPKEFGQVVTDPDKADSCPILGVKVNPCI